MHAAAAGRCAERASNSIARGLAARLGVILGKPGARVGAVLRNALLQCVQTVVFAFVVQFM